MFHVSVLTRLLLAAAAVALALPATAAGAVSLGQTSNGGATCPGDQTIAQTASSTPEYSVRADGVITQLRTENVTVAGRRLHVLRPRGNDAFQILASVPVTPAAGVIRIPVRVPVEPGDILGLSVPASADPQPNCRISDAAEPYDVVQARTGQVSDQGEVTLPDQDLGRLNVAATLEPDADADGFGDDSQDRCPDDQTRSTQECSADLVVSQVPVERDLERDDVNVITISVRNNGSSLARDVRVIEAMPAGVQLVATTPSSGGCAGGAPVDCTFPVLPAGATGTLLVVVKTVATGTKTLTANVTSPTPDPNSVNNMNEVEFEVGQRRSVVVPGAFCRVPRLTGLSRTAARRALEAAGCRLGRTSYRRFRTGRTSRVRLQSIPARIRVATGTRVNITIKRR